MGSYYRLAPVAGFWWTMGRWATGGASDISTPKIPHPADRTLFHGWFGVVIYGIPGPATFLPLTALPRRPWT